MPRMSKKRKHELSFYLNDRGRVTYNELCRKCQHGCKQSFRAVAEMFKEFDRKEAAYRLRTYRHKAYYSLDRDDGLEHEAVFVALSPHELYERKVTMQELHAAIASLPDKQAKRIYAHFILGMTKQDIARAEGVHEKVVRVAIERGLRRLEKILKISL